MPLTDQEISKKVRELRKTRGLIYAPLKYFRGLKTLKDVETRYIKMLKRDYTTFKTDEGVDPNILIHPKIPQEVSQGQIPPRYSESYEDTPKDAGDYIQPWSRCVENWAQTRSFSTGVGLRESS